MHNQCTSQWGSSGSNLMKSHHWVSMNASIIRVNKKQTNKKPNLFSLDRCSGTSSKHYSGIDSMASRARNVLPCRHPRFRAVQRPSFSCCWRAVSWSPGRNRFVQPQHRGSEAAVNHWPSGAQRCCPGQEGLRRRSAQAAHSRASICCRRFPVSPAGPQFRTNWKERRQAERMTMCNEGFVQNEGKNSIQNKKKRSGEVQRSSFLECTDSCITYYFREFFSKWIFLNRFMVDII